MALMWILVFLTSLYVLVKGAGYLIKSAEIIGRYFGIPRFAIGVMIVGVGTSIPELGTALAAVFRGVDEIVVASAIGSNIANILLIVGISALYARTIKITKDLLDSELPMFVISTIIFIGVAIDGQVTFIEALMLFLAYLIYLFYTIRQRGEGDPVIEKATHDIAPLQTPTWIDYLSMVGGVTALFFGAKYLVEASIALAGAFHVPAEIISITALAIGTSIPELAVSIEAIRKHKQEIAIGNILGSNAFNILMVVGIPGLITTLHVDTNTLAIGVPVLGAATFILFIKGISRIIYWWEGALLLIFYSFFVLKLFGVA